MVMVPYTPKILAMHDKIITKHEVKYHPTGSRLLQAVE